MFDAEESTTYIDEVTSCLREILTMIVLCHI